MLRFGHQEKAVVMYLVGLMPFVILIIINQMEGMPFWYSLLMVVGMFITFMGMVWLPLQISKLRLRPLLDESSPNETVLLRFTKDRIFIPMFAPKGSYGVAKGLNYGEKADYIDDGEFPVKCLNGNSAIITYDMLNTAIDLNRSVARKYMKKHAPSGTEAYRIAERQGKVMVSDD